MKIKSIEYTNSAQLWRYEKIDFFNLTLLVGLSGAGKTQILKSILAIREVAKGESINGIKWDIAFSVGNEEYCWRGETEKIQSTLASEVIFWKDDDDTIKPKLIFEEIKLNGEIIARRERAVIEFEHKKMPKLSPTESLLKIFKEEDKIKPAFDGFENIIFRDHTQKAATFSFNGVDLKKIQEKYKTIEEIRNSDLDTIHKLLCVYENAPDVFEEIKDRFIDVFSQVEDVKIEPLSDENVPILLGMTPIIQIREKYVDEWIPHSRISSGMLRTFIHISEMYLWPKGTVILIDEFENSLGVNCINILTEDLIFENSRVQFIATSHHPYIINKIPYEYWKIVTRKGGKIITNNAVDFELGKSHHERFMNLVNLPQFRT